MSDAQQVGLDPTWISRVLHLSQTNQEIRAQQAVGDLDARLDHAHQHEVRRWLPVLRLLLGLADTQDDRGGTPRVELHANPNVGSVTR